MCGRYCLYDDGNEELRAILDRTEGDYKTGEIFPTDKAPVLIQQSGKIRPQAVAWGFPGFRGKGVIINARAETVPDKAMFRDCLLTKRCVIPSSGFFEWSHTGPKTKYQFNLPDENVLYMAGLYQDFGDKRCYVIITTAANESMAEVHNRMPVILLKGEMKKWLCDNLAAEERLIKRQPLLIKSQI